MGSLCTLAREENGALVAGIVEREGGTLYCTAVFITAAGDIGGRHRKLMPTAVERVVWGQATELELTTMDTSAGRVGAAICWENYVPLCRYALYENGIDVRCAPIVDDRDIWRTSMRHIAYEGRCFVLSACQVQPPATSALGRTITMRDRPEDQPMIRGVSMIVSPLGEVLGGPLEETEGLLTAEVDLNDIARARFDLDLVGHYSRRELFDRP